MDRLDRQRPLRRRSACSSRGCVQAAPSRRERRAGCCRCGDAARQSGGCSRPAPTHSTRSRRDHASRDRAARPQARRTLRRACVSAALRTGFGAKAVSSARKRAEVAFGRRDARLALQHRLRLLFGGRAHETSHRRSHQGRGLGNDRLVVSVHLQSESCGGGHRLLRSNGYGILIQ